MGKEIQLGDEARDFLLALALRCESLDLASLVETLMNPSSSGAKPGDSLVQLAVQWKSLESDQRRAQFNQAAIEMEIFRRCQR